MNARFYFLSLLCLLFSANLFSQQPVQTIRGVVVDRASGAPIPYANVVIVNTNPLMGTITDSLGHFSINRVPIGRYDIRASFVGYNPMQVHAIEVSSAKETFLTIPLKEKVVGLSEIVVKPGVIKEKPLDEMATVSARLLSVDEASRYAGGFDDPARLAASFAGVASNVANNGIVVRGNSPKDLQWRMEGVEIPNPNHFADMATFGGGGLTALSTHLLANSDFLTGAFPAEYSNALSGVFDIYMRNGNNTEHENSFKLGIVGIEWASEGPFQKGKQSSYIFNYRYSTLALLAPVLPEHGGGTRYQDLSFKMHFPTKKSGVFSVWGIGLLDRSGGKAKRDSTQWVYADDREDQTVKQYMGAAGINHKYYFNRNVFVKTTLAATVSGLDYVTNKLNNKLVMLPENRINNKNWNFVLSSYLNTKFSSRHTNRSGIVLTGLMYDMLLRQAPTSGEPLQTDVNEHGFSMLLTAYTSSIINFAHNMTAVVGLNGQLFTLNKHYTIEPRISLKWQFRPNQSIAVAYGNHSRLERINYYFTKNYAHNNVLYNKNLDFTKAHHFVISYDWSIRDNLHLKVEPYLQLIYDVPVVPDSSFSFINLQNDWFFNHKLVNQGKGRNIGVDFTLEQYLTKGFYFMVTASIFDSKYKGGDRIWRDTRYDRNFLFNFLTGKEWQTGKNKANVFGLNVRLSYQGGDHYVPVDLAASVAAKDVVYDGSNAFLPQLPAAFTTYFTAIYKINRKKVAHEISLKVINATMYKEFENFRYNYVKNTVDMQTQMIFIPNLSYKIDF